MTRDKLLFFLYLFALVSLFLFSYTQVDLNLTLSKLPEILNIQRFLQYIGFFQRPLATALFALISILFFVLYIVFLRSAKKNHITKKETYFLVISTALILTFSFNAFSYDLFNYIFDAKIITHYNLNPYMYKALDFSGDPMLLFMHWTHRLYPYGPIWLLETVPLSFLGLGFFLPTLFLFKSLAAVCYLGTVYFVGTILKKLSPAPEKCGILFFALNPLVIIESLVSAHNDISMMFFAMWAFYCLINKKYTAAFLLLILSSGIKFAAILLLPIFIYVFLKKGNVNWERMIIYSILLMILAVITASIRTTFQPWYMIYVLPFVSLIGKRYILPTIIISMLGVFYYIPFLYLGNWDNPVPKILSWSTTLSIITILFIIGSKYRKI